MAWNDPPSFDYQQISNTGRKFKHRYVLSDTNSKFSPSSPQFQQTAGQSYNNQPVLAPSFHGQSQQSYDFANQSQPSYHNNTNSNGTMNNATNHQSSTTDGNYHGLNSNCFGTNDYSSRGTNPNDVSCNNLIYSSQPQQYQSPSGPPPQAYPHQQG